MKVEDKYKAVGDACLVLITIPVEELKEDTNYSGLIVSSTKSSQGDVEFKWEGEVISKGTDFGTDVLVGDTVKLFPLMNGATALVDEGEEDGMKYKIFNVKIGDILAVIK